MIAQVRGRDFAGLLELEGDSDCGECNYFRTLLSSSSPPHTIECDFIETGSVDGTSLLPSKAHF